MTDLIKRLGDPNRDWPEFGHDRREAADRIEELEKERDELKEYIDRYSYTELGDEAEARCLAEAKLAKTIDALREIITRWDTPSWKDVEATGSVINRARAVLAELEKE